MRVVDRRLEELVGREERIAASTLQDRWTGFGEDDPRGGSERA
jgi:hypothetical protein